MARIAFKVICWYEYDVPDEHVHILQDLCNKGLIESPNDLKEFEEEVPHELISEEYERMLDVAENEGLATVELDQGVNRLYKNGYRQN